MYKQLGDREQSCGLHVYPMSPSHLSDKRVKKASSDSANKDDVLS